MDNAIQTELFAARLFDETQRVFACHAVSQQDFSLWSRVARPALQELLGLEQIARELGEFVASVDLAAEAATFPGDSRRRGVLHSEPGVDIPFWLLEPDGPGPHPIAILPHGHENFGMDTYVGIAHDAAKREKIEREDRDVAVQAARRGMLAIAPTTRGFFPATIPDERKRHGGRHCRSYALHTALAGRTATGDRVWDMMRLLDWATARSDTDASRILAMGNSGGGMVTTYLAACDPRVAVAVPSCSFCSLASPEGHLHHCDCNLVPGIFRWGEFWDVAGLIAPRHLLVVNGAHDSLFPLAEVDRAVVELARLFAAAEVPDHFVHCYGDGGHRFYKDLMWPFVEQALSQTCAVASRA
ncbi:MAG: prolyl oligopeptidase family serine peptidase [Victivallales bacterium]|nr:prolyl oligopeptidase family serine peptidase [Victivallales bacterium]